MKQSLVNGAVMPIDISRFNELYERFLKIDFTGKVLGVRPPLKNERDVRAATAKGVPFLPRIYQQNFHAPMDAALPQLLVKLASDVKQRLKTEAQATERLEQFYAPVYQHGPDATKVHAGPQLKRFLAVVSNLFRSFTDDDKRALAGIHLVTTTPPLAFFQSDSGQQGPYTIESDLMHHFFGIEIGIVSLPATYRDHPVIWSVLSHEVCGHDVVHADAGLLAEMTEAVQGLLAPDFSPHGRLDNAALNALLWSYWMDEAAADVYGVLNMGPAFAPSLAAFLAAFRCHIKTDVKGEPPPAKPVVAVEASPRDNEGGDDTLEDHPVDILRFHLMLGATEAMAKLDAAKRADYVAAIEGIARVIGGGADTIHIQGQVRLGSGQPIPVKADMPLAEAAAAARKVGRMIATQKFKALNNRSIQDIETWDDADEAVAEAISARILQRQSIVGHGDDAQLLAGATLALLRKPERYDETQSLLNAALDESFRTDPIWRDLVASHVFAPHVFRRPEAKAKAAAARTKRPAGKSAPKKRKR
jgi:hypothetical protein